MGGQSAYIPAESVPLEGLGKVNQELVRELARRGEPQKIATVDMDATVVESWKRQALPTYQGGRGYQPMLALWAERNLVLAEQFREGNVPAIQEPLSVARRAFGALPEGIEERYFRGDAACYESDLLSWLRDPKRPAGPEGFIGFAVSVPLIAPLRAAILEVPEANWKLYREDEQAQLDCARVEYYPQEKPEQTYWEPLRYVAIRVRHKQGELFADGKQQKYFVVASNLWDWEPKRLLEWHREKAGPVEALHDVWKNELAAGVMPCGRFGANAAWLRLNVLRHNVLVGLKRLALPPELLAARPKRLRFLVFHTPGKRVRHARRMKLRLLGSWRRFTNWRWALRQMPLPTAAPG